LAIKTKNRVFGKLRKKRLGYRIIGWWFIVLGGFMCFTFGNLVLDPEGIINYNGVDTTSFEVKQNAFLFTVIFPVIGAIWAFFSKRKLTKLLIWQARVNPFSSV
jgi:hypothetical protein